jgi:uncharacterized membrane protein
MRLILLVFAAFVLAATPARAGLTVCNKSAAPAKVALGRFNGTEWMSEGWWQIPPNHCSELAAGRLDARYYYLYATDGAAGTWEGKSRFCAAPAERFAIVGRGACAARGYDRKGFFEIDTGDNFNWTQTLQ